MAATNKSNIESGVDRSHGSSFPQKMLFFTIQFISLIICFQVIHANVNFHFATWSWSQPPVYDITRARIFFAASILYALRLAITLFYVFQRKFNWTESIGLGIMMLVFETGLCLLAAGYVRHTAIPIDWLDYTAIIFVLLGSYLNTYSETQRKHWKDKPENQGKCYAQVLFSYSRHINYFGDCIMFTGWCLLTANFWTLAIPAIMACLFVFYHIPGLEHYLEKRYGNEFTSYKKQTKKFIPFIY